MNRQQVLAEVLAETRRQDQLFGSQRTHSDGTWQLILTEEVGEAAEAALHRKFGGKGRDNLREELIQVAAVAVQWVMCLDANQQEED